MKAILSSVVWLILFYCAMASLSCIDCQSDHQQHCIRERKDKCEQNYKKHASVVTSDDDELTPKRCCPEIVVRECLRQVYTDCGAKSWFVFVIPTAKCVIFDNGITCGGGSVSTSNNNDDNKIVNSGQFSKMNANSGDSGGSSYTTSSDTSDPCAGSSWKSTSKFIFIFLLIRFIFT